MNMDENKALEIIEQMISSAKREIRDNGFYHMMWGYFVFVSALVDYFLLMMEHENHALVWAIMMPLGGIISIIKGKMEKRGQRVITYVDEVLKYLGTAFVISLLIVCFVMPSTAKHWRSFYPVLMVLYAFGLYITGGILQFNTMRYGAMGVWACAIAAFFVGYDLQLLILALAVLVGFIIPGHLLNLRFRQNV
jgi:hypothetical protein